MPETTTVKITMCEYRQPRKSDLTFRAAAKYSIRNRGHQRSSLTAGYSGDKPLLARTTMYNQAELRA